MSMEAIRAESDRAARVAARTGKRPYVIFDAAEVDRLQAAGRMPFPFLGSYRPKGWTLCEELFCDASGMGSESEPALTVRALCAKLREYVAKDATYGFAVTEAGPFQVYVGVFRKVERRGRKVS